MWWRNSPSAYEPAGHRSPTGAPACGSSASWRPLRAAWLLAARLWTCRPSDERPGHQMSDQPAAGSVVIPAHNEARVIGRLLARLTGERAADDLEVIVVANGCTDDTVQVANSYGAGVRVVELAQASKRAALDEGDRLARAFPRVYVDADVELSSDDVRSLIEALREPGILAAAPELTMELTGRPWLVRWYYDVWTRLPEVRSGLFGRGVFGVSEEGYHRLTGLPPVIGDDLAASLAFQPAEW